MTTQAADYLEAIDHLPPGATLTLQHVGWDDYEQLLTELTERPGLRVSYDRGRMEIMSPLLEHEEYKGLIHDLVRILPRNSTSVLKLVVRLPSGLRTEEKVSSPMSVFMCRMRPALLVNARSTLISIHHQTSSSRSSSPMNHLPSFPSTQRWACPRFGVTTDSAHSSMNSPATLTAKLLQAKPFPCSHP